MRLFFQFAAFLAVLFPISAISREKCDMFPKSSKGKWICKYDDKLVEIKSKNLGVMTICRFECFVKRAAFWMFCKKDGNGVSWVDLSSKKKYSNNELRQKIQCDEY